MKKNIIFIICILFFYDTFLSAQPLENRQDKRIAVSMNPFGLIVLGPNIQIENTAFGPYGFYIGYENYDLGLMSRVLNNQYDLELSGHSISLGIKYYIEYDNDYYDAFYISLECLYSHGEANHVDDSTISAKVTDYRIMFFGGRRFQWDVFFLDLSAGFGFVYQVTQTSDAFLAEYDVQELNSELGEVAGISYDLRLMCGVAF